MINNIKNRVKPILLLGISILFIQFTFTDAYAYTKNKHYLFLNQGITTINVKRAGAAGDGITDDYPSIEKAISQSNGPVKIYFPAGSYLVSQAIATTHEEITFMFSKNAKLIIPNNSSGGIILKNNNCKITGGYFQGNGLSSNDLMKGFGVMLSGVSNCEVLNCTFDKIGGIDIFLINAGKNGCVQCLIKNNHIKYPAFSRKLVQDAAGIMLGYSGSGYFHTMNLISGNTIDGNETLAHGIALITHGKNNTIIGNSVKNCLRYGIVAYESSYEDYTLSYTNVINNIVQNIGTPNSEPASVYGMGIYLKGSHYSIVKNNKVTHCLVNTNNQETLPSGAIALNGSTHCTVDSNIISDSHRYGIACSLSFYSTITNNLIDSVGESGIYLINTAFNTIKNNKIKRVTVYGIKGLFGNTSRPNYAAQSSIKEFQNLSTGQGIEISHNLIDGSKTKVISFTGEDPDSKINYAGNKLDKISIHDNTITGTADPDKGIILDKAVENGTNSILHNKTNKE